MNEARQRFSREERRPQQVRLLALLALAVSCVGCQPKEVVPGMWIRGEPIEEQVDDWTFARETEEIFIETRAWYGLPHSTTIWCVEQSGNLYIGSYGDKKKTWEKNVARNPEVRLAIAGKIYEVAVTPVTDRALVDTLDDAYTQKYEMAEVFGDDLPEWWYYRVEQRDG
jgi:hypothetical protein